jgi:uncharacterized membrane protein
MADPTARRGYGVRRLVLAAVVFAAAVVIAWAARAPVGVAVAAAWGTAALAVLFSVWIRIARWSAADTAAHARAEDFSRTSADAIVLTACVCSLVPVGYTIAEAGRRHGSEKALLMLLAIVVVALSWALVHTVYALRYGDLYYGGTTGGIEFNETDPPDYRDFAYIAMTIGMTYQVSDTNLTAKAVRRTVARHALLSFLFGSIIIALLVNSVASLLR